MPNVKDHAKYCDYKYKWTTIYYGDSNGKVPAETHFRATKPTPKNNTRNSMFLVLETLNMS